MKTLVAIGLLIAYIIIWGLLRQMDPDDWRICYFWFGCIYGPTYWWWFNWKPRRIWLP